MKMVLAVLLMSACPCWAQEVPPERATPGEEQTPSAPTESTITVPAGTRVELALANPLRGDVARVGDSVRAVTTFPVTVGKELAIPEGTFLEGSIVKIGKRGSTLFDGLDIRFRQEVFANGYNLALDGSVVNAKAVLAGGPLGLMASTFQQPPTPPPLPQLGPPKGAVIGAVVGGMAAFVVTAVLLQRHRLPQEPRRDFDTGFQFEIVLESPLTLDHARVASALNPASSQ